MSERQYRYIKLQEAQWEQRADGGLVLRGYAALFDVETVIYGMFREVIRKGAFAKSISEDDIRCIWNHNDDVVLGRNTAGTLRLAEDDKGLRFECDLPDTQLARDGHVSIQRGDVNQMSFRFVPVRTSYTMGQAPGELDLRELLELELQEISPVTFPAYPLTEVEARSVAEMERPSEVNGPPEVDAVSLELRRRAVDLEEAEMEISLALARQH